jgi:hypothetical protein
VRAPDRTRLVPPIWPGATPSVSAFRRTQLIAVLIATLNRRAAAFRDSPLSTADTTRARRSIE